MNGNERVFQKISVVPSQYPILSILCIDVMPPVRGNPMTISEIRRQVEVPEYEAIVFSLLPWARQDRYREFFRWDLPAPAR